MKKILSKSKYMAGLACPRKLWLQLWQPELAAEPQGMDRLIMEQGTLFGELAHGLFPGATLIDIDIRNLAQAEADTQTAMANGAGVILEATFRHGQYRVLSDVVERMDDGSWHLIEVKSSTKAKAEHIPDLAYQRYVMESLGYSVSRCSVVHANTDGQWPNIKDYFCSTDVTGQIEDYLPNIEPSLTQLDPLLLEGSPCPDIAYSKTCAGCEMRAHCWHDIDKPTIYDVIDKRKIEEMETDGIFFIDDIPADYPLSAGVRTLVDRMQQQTVDVDTQAIQSMLDRLQYPVYFLDFESASIAMPLFDDSSPWQKYAFQYSLHVQQTNGDVEHIEFLHQDNSDPSESIARSLVEHIGSEGSVVVYNKTMEKGVLMALAARFPQMHSALKSMADRIWDLELVFKKPYRHWQWGTRSSIKKVLPTLVPGLSYDDLAIQEGGSATAQWITLLACEDEQQKANIANDLLRYCELDTLAMVRLLEAVKTVVK